MKKRIITTGIAIALAIGFAPIALAQTSVQGGPLTNLNPNGDKIHLALANYPTAHGLYIFEAVKADSGRPTTINTASQVWVGTAQGATDPKGDIVVNVDLGHAWGADCAHQVCGLFIRLDHTASTDTSEDQFIPITFAAAATTAATTLPADSISTKIDGLDVKENVPGKISYRQVITFSATTASGSAVTIASMVPDLCPVSGNTVTALKGTGACDIAVTSAGNASYAAKTSHYPLIVGLGTQTITSSYSVKVEKVVKVDLQSNFGEKISYKVNNAKICSFNGKSVKGLKAGKCNLVAKAAGTANYAALNKIVVVNVK